MIKGHVVIRRPRVDGKKMDIYEHRLIAQQMLGRDLTSEEHVHHINADPTDNRPENLVVLCRADHKRLEAAMARAFTSGWFGGVRNPKQALMTVVLPALDVEIEVRG